MGKIRPGSTFKTFGLIAALEQGLPLDLTLPSAPFISSIYYSDHLHSPWKVRNYAHRYHGRLDLVTALALSDNTVFARLSEMLSPTQLVSVYKRFGLVSDAESNPGIVLGGTRKGASVLQLVTAYAAIARGGIAISPRLLRAVE